MSVSVKICGLSEPGGLAAAIEAGAQMVGFVFFEKSPRHISLQTAQKLGSLVPPHVAKVALIVDASDDEISGIIDALKPDYLQAHGNETPERIAQIKKIFGKKLIKAIGVADGSDIKRARDYIDICDLILLDAKAPKDLVDALPGGNGITFDWTLLTGHKPKAEFMLSGGLNADNLETAIKLTKPQWVDVSSGVETAPGKKSEDLIRQFIKTAKSVCHGQG